MNKFDLLLNGAPAAKNETIPSGTTETRTFVVSHHRGGDAAGKLVKIEASAPTFISNVQGNLDENGQFQFVVGPSFNTKGSFSLTIKVGNRKKSVEITYV